MARAKEKTPKLKKPMSKTAKILCITIPSVIALAALIVGLVFLIKYLTRDTSEKKYDAVFESGNTITYKQFSDKLDDGIKSSIDEEVIYVFVYSDNTDDFAISSSVTNLVKECISAYESSSKQVGFYLLNAYLDDNAGILSASIVTTNFTDSDRKSYFTSKTYSNNCPCLVKIEGSKITDVTVKTGNDGDLKDELGKVLEEFKK